MIKIFGDFVEDLPTGTEYLILGFSPASIPLKERWRTNGLSADFLADYLTTFFPRHDEIDPNLDKTDEAKIAEVKSAVSYIANELLENAMKFGTEPRGYPISIQLHLSSERIIFVTTNSMNLAQIADFQDFLTELSTEDPIDLYVRTVEKNALDDSSTSSGVGFLTMINDYGAKLGWKFQEMSGEQKAIAVTTMVQLLL
jgi:hypothetical protein